MEEVNNERGNEAQRNPNSHRRRQTVIRFTRNRFQPTTSEVDGLLATVDNNGDALVTARRAVPTVIQQQHNVNNYESLGKRLYKHMEAYVFSKNFDMSLPSLHCFRANLN
jgi:hypothetical protein